MKIILCNYGDQLTTRDIGAVIRTEIAKQVEEGNVVIDFEGIVGITQSCADEMVGVLVLNLGFEVFKDKVTFANASNDIKSVIKYVVRQRIASQDV